MTSCLSSAFSCTSARVCGVSFDKSFRLAHMALFHVLPKPWHHVIFLCIQKHLKKPRPLGFPPFLSKVKDILQQAAHSSWDALVCRSMLDLGERPWVACWSQNRQLLGPRNCLCKNHFQLAVMFPASTKFQEFKHPLRKWEAKKLRGLWRRNESITWIVQGHSHSFLSFTKEASWTFSDTGLELP